MDREFVLSRVSGSLIGMAVGDALGLPVNGMSKYEVTRKYQVLDNYFPFKDIKGGTYTWAARSALLIGKSINECKGINPEGIAKCFATVSPNELFIDDSKEAILTKTLSNSNSPKLATRVVPIALYMAMKVATDGELIKTCKLVADPTHSNKQTILSAFVIAKIIYESIRNRKGLEHQFDLFQGENSLLARTTNLVRRTEDSIAIQENRISERLLFTRRMLQRRATLEEFLGQNGNFRNIDECVCFSVFSFMKNPDDYRGVTSVVSCGGESSLNGALTGAMIGAYSGTGFMTRDIKEGVKNYADIVLLSESLTEQFFKEDDESNKRD